MTKLTINQIQLFKEMLNQIEDFISDDISFQVLIINLDKLFISGRFKDTDLINQWSKYWIPLYSYKNDKHIQKITSTEVGLSLDNLHKFISDLILQK